MEIIIFFAVIIVGNYVAVSFAWSKLVGSHPEQKHVVMIVSSLGSIIFPMGTTILASLYILFFKLKLMVTKVEKPAAVAKVPELKPEAKTKTEPEAKPQPVVDPVDLSYLRLYQDDPDDINDLL
ncbi:hypothetical protein [Flavobacterium sp.]|uniref:hypothetical protein n=1 Tax=Flavobacterium sp. TaxID=239 RepID=UPI00260FEB6F|nr:hypothetical protein [Flavobacterium sp.]